MKTASKSLNNSRVYFCSVPIGNDDDITIRVKQQLHITPTIACEDTRVTKQLLKRLGIWQNQSLIRLDQHTENNQNWAWLASALLLGPVSVVSDAGTPGINDPGAKCMAHCIAHHIPIELLPGVSALTAIMTLSTRPITNLSFKGFFPRQHAQIIDAITWTVQQQCHCVWFESPKRLLKTIQQIATQTPSAQLTLAKELTKPHQKILCGTAAQCAEELAAIDCRGEWVIMMDGASVPADAIVNVTAIAIDLKQAGLTAKQVKAVAKHMACQKNELYTAFIGL